MNGPRIPMGAGDAQALGIPVRTARQPAHDAVDALIAELGERMPATPVERNALLWRAVSAVLATRQPAPVVGYRVGRKLGRTVYSVQADGLETCVGMLDSPEIAAGFVAAGNASLRHVCDERFVAGGCPDCRPPQRPAGAVDRSAPFQHHQPIPSGVPGAATDPPSGAPGLDPNPWDAQDGPQDATRASDASTDDRAQIGRQPDAEAAQWAAPAEAQTRAAEIGPLPVPIEAVRAFRWAADAEHERLLANRLIDHADIDTCTTAAGLAAALTQERDRISRILVPAVLAAIRCIPDGEIRRGCLVYDGANVRERLRRAYLAIRDPELAGSQPEHVEREACAMPDAAVEAGARAAYDADRRADEPHWDDVAPVDADGMRTYARTVLAAGTAAILRDAANHLDRYALGQPPGSPFRNGLVQAADLVRWIALGRPPCQPANRVDPADHRCHQCGHPVALHDDDGCAAREMCECALTAANLPPRPVAGV